jgi:hypothetical protein
MDVKHCSYMKCMYLINLKRIQVAVRSTVYVYGRSIAGIAGANSIVSLCR